MIRRSLILAAAALALAACGQGAERPPTGPAPLIVGATAVPHAEILEFIKPTLAAEGFPIEIKVFNDYVQPNTQLAEGRLDANYFQTKPYLDEFNAARGADLVTVAGVHVEPLGAYSRKFKALADLPNGADVALPNDASNTGRSLLLLQSAGLITLRDRPEPAADGARHRRQSEESALPRDRGRDPAARAGSGRSGGDQHQLCAGRRA